MDHERFSTASKGTPKGAEGRGYHHGDRVTVSCRRRAKYWKNSLAALTLRAVARKAGVSHAAPYRHFPNHEALLVELSVEGFDELRGAIAEAAKAQGSKSDEIATIGAAYMRFVAQRPALARLMFGGRFPNRDQFPELEKKADSIGNEIGAALHDSALGLAVWSAVHGLAMLVLENVIDLGQRRSGLHVLQAPTEIILRSLFSTERE